MSNSLLLLFKKGWPWVNHSHRSLKKSNCEGFALVALDKRATVSELLLSLFKKDWFAGDLSKLLSKNKHSTFTICSKSRFFVCFSFFSHFFVPKSEVLLSLVAPLLFLKSNRSNSLLLLFTKDIPWANCSRRTLQKSDREWFALLQERNTILLQKKERFAWKTKERIPNPGLSQSVSLIVATIMPVIPCSQYNPASLGVANNFQLHSA